MDIESILIEGAGSGQAIGDTQYLVKNMDYKY